MSWFRRETPTPKSLYDVYLRYVHEVWQERGIRDGQELENVIETVRVLKREGL
jgi:hypothetical protein